MPPKKKPIAERFWPKVDRRGDDECWPWLAAKTAKGYGKFGWHGRNEWVNAHRASWILHNGSVPYGLDVDHLCHNPSCVNPAHLEAVTHAENMRRTRPALAAHCQRGHEYGEERNTVTGRRFCGVCAREREMKRVRS